VRECKRHVAKVETWDVSRDTRELSGEGDVVGEARVKGQDRGTWDDWEGEIGTVSGKGQALNKNQDEQYYHFVRR
jgi:hypothetical protein